MDSASPRPLDSSCRGCGYDLATVPTPNGELPVCPECGEVHVSDGVYQARHASTVERESRWILGGTGGAIVLGTVLSLAFPRLGLGPTVLFLSAIAGLLGSLVYCLVALRAAARHHGLSQQRLAIGCVWLALGVLAFCLFLGIWSAP